MNNTNNTEQYKKEIRDWFASNKDFDEGFLLFVRFSHNRALAMQLGRKRMQSKLEYELQKILDRGVVIERAVFPIGQLKKAVAPVVEKKTAVAGENQKIEKTIDDLGRKRVKLEDTVDYDALNDEQKALYDSFPPAYKEMRSWHEKMKLAKTDEERKELRARVVELDDTIRENWKKFEASFEPAADPDPDAAKEIDPVKAISNARSYLSKNLPKLEKLEGKKLDALKAKIKERYETIINAKQVVDDETVVKLKACGIIVE